MSYRLEIWTIAQKWMTMNENVKKEVKKWKGREKDENKKDENKKLKWLPNELETWNLDHCSDVNDNEWKCEKRRKNNKKIK